MYFAVNSRYEKWQRKQQYICFLFILLQVKTKRDERNTLGTLSDVDIRRYAMAATLAAGETAAALSRDGLRGTRPPPSRFGFLAKSPTRWPISLSPGRHHAAPAAAASAKEEGSAWVELEPICSEQQLDQVFAEAQQLDLPIVLLW
jgi:hypothetical protein